MINIAIADDHLLFVQSLKQMLETEDGINVAGIGKNGLELLEIVTSHRINLAIVDLRMPVMNGMDTCKQLRASHPEIKIIVLSMYHEEVIADELKALGVTGYVSKTSESEDFINTIYFVCEGKTIFPEYGSGSKMKLSQPANTGQFIIDLTSREKEIVSLISRGFTSPVIAAKLFISINTVKGHRKNILKKLNLDNIQELVAFAVKKGFC